jgi:cytochrome c oxidase assembly factor CtaG
MSEFLKNLRESIPKFLEALSIVRICPEQIEAPKQLLAFNVPTLTISLAIFVLARMSIGGSSGEIDAVIIASLISAAILFMTGFVILLIAPGPNAMENSKKWGAFFVMLWLTSLVFLVFCDALPFWLDHTPMTTYIIDHLFGPDGVEPRTKDVMRAIIFGLIALALILVKSKRMDPAFRVFAKCSVIACLIGLTVNTLLIVGVIYQHHII